MANDKNQFLFKVRQSCAVNLHIFALLNELLNYLSFLQPSIDLPEVFSEELFSNGLSIDSNSLSNFDQMGGTAKQECWAYS